MRVALLTERVARDGGVGVYVCRLAEALRARGDEVLVAGGEVADGAVGAGVAALRVPGLDREEPVAGVPARLTAALRDFGAEVVGAHHVYDPALVPAVQAVAPLVWGVHEYMLCPTGTLHFGPGEECGRAHGPGCWPHILLHGCAHRRDLRPVVRTYRRSARSVGILRGVDGVVAFSRFVAANLRRNGIDDPHVAPLWVPRETRRHPEPPGRPSILFAGRVTESKGLHVLVEALASVDALLEVHGDGWALPEVRARARALGVEDRVRFCGWSAEAELQAAYDRASVVAVPSVWPEPFGLVGLEAMSHGRPVVASATGGIPEWLDDGVTGRLVPAGDVPALATALDAMLTDGTLRQRMGIAAVERVERHFTIAAHLEALDVVHEAAAERWHARIAC